MDTVFDLQMFADDDDDTDATVTTGDVLDDNQTATGEPEKPQKSLTQDDLNRVAVKEREKGKKQASREIEKEFGCTKDEAKTILGTAKQIQELLNIPLPDVHEFLRQRMQTPTQPQAYLSTYAPTAPQRDAEEEADHEFTRKQRTEERPLNDLRQTLGNDVFNELLPRAEALATEEDLPIAAAFRRLLPEELPRIIAKQRASAQAEVYEKLKEGRVYSVESGGGVAPNLAKEEALTEQEEQLRKAQGQTRREWIETKKMIGKAKSRDFGKGSPNIEDWRRLQRHLKQQGKE